MLTEGERSRIRMEEIYRFEVRHSLREKPSRSTRDRIWNFLNTGVGLWLLSTVAVGLITAAYGAWSTHNDKKELAQRSAAKLDLEIGNRIERLSFHLALLQKMNEATVLNIGDLLRGADTVRSQPYLMGVFDEYKDRSLSSLLWELSTVVDRADQAAVINAFQAARRLNDIAAAIVVGDRSDENKKAQVCHAVLQELNGPLGLLRWHEPHLPEN